MLLGAMEREAAGPYDDFDPEVNGDPGSTVGEEDERGFDEMPAVYWPDEQLGDDGFDDAEGEDEDDDVSNGGEEDDKD